MRRSLMRQFTTLSVVIVLVVCISFGFLLHYIGSYSMTAARQIQSNNHQQVLYRLREYFDSIDNAAYSMCYAPTLQTYIQTDDSGGRISLATNMRSVYSSTYLLLDSLIGIAMFDPEGDYIASSVENIFHLEGLPEPWSQVKGNQYTGLYQEGDGPQVTRDCFGMVTPVYSLQPGTRLLNQRIGTAVLTFSTSYLRGLVSSGNLPENYLLVLADAQGQLLAASSSAARDYYLSGLWQTQAPAASETTPLETSGWTLYSFMPHSVIADDMKPLMLLTGLMSVLFILLLAVLLLRLRHSILHPIYHLGEFMTRIAENRSKERFVFYAENELGHMIRMFNSMLDALDENSKQLRHSESQMYQAELSRREMEILAYRNQINPHFLYNTLDCIRGIALYYHSEEIVAISESLSTMFRYAVKGENFSTVAQEIAHVQEYITIISYRFMNRIRITVEAEDGVDHLRTLKLSMQPLVENAVFHGLEKKVGEGHIHLRVHRDKSFLYITVTDDGLGIEPEKLARLQQNLAAVQQEDQPSPKAERSIGLANIARRLHLFYGSASRITLESSPSAGTRVVVMLPAQEGDSTCIR